MEQQSLISAAVTSEKKKRVRLYWCTAYLLWRHSWLDRHKYGTKQIWMYLCTCMQWVCKFHYRFWEKNESSTWLEPAENNLKCAPTQEVGYKTVTYGMHTRWNSKQQLKCCCCSYPLIVVLGCLYQKRKLHHNAFCNSLS